MTNAEELTRKLAAEKERADYAWKNTRAIEAARAEEMRKRDAAEAENKRLRDELAKWMALADANAKLARTCQRRHERSERTGLAAPNVEFRRLARLYAQGRLERRVGLFPPPTNVIDRAVGMPAELQIKKMEVPVLRQAVYP